MKLDSLGIWQTEKEKQVFMILGVMDLAAILTYYMALSQGATAQDFISTLPLIFLFGMAAYAFGSMGRTNEQERSL